MQRFLSNIDSKRAVETAVWITQNAPYRLAGSDRDQKVADYLAGQLESIGLQVEMNEFMGFVGHPGEGSLQVVSPAGVEFSAPVWPYSMPLPPEGLEAEVVYCGHGGEEDYVGKDVRGKIPLTNLSFSPPRPEKARLAKVNGASALLIMNFLSGEFDNLPEGNLKPMWGNPTDKDWHLVEALIPAAGIHRATGDRLIELAKQGPVKIRLKLDVENKWRKLRIPIGYLPSASGSEDFLLIGGHKCSWTGGATDNASGNGAMLEIARAAVANRDRLRRGLMVGFWTAHEQGTMDGSTWIVDSHWDQLEEHAVAYVIMDGMGRMNTSEFRTRCTPEARDFCARAAKEALGFDVPTGDLNKTGDQSLFGMGVPMISVKSNADAETRKRWQGADSSWWWHSKSDTLDKLDANVLQRETIANAGIVWRACTDEVLGYRFKPLADRIARRLGELQEGAGDNIDLAKTMSWAAEFQKGAEALDAASDAGKDTNKAQMRLSRALTGVTFSVAGRWAQDPYGLSDLKTFIPGLRSAIDLPKLKGSEQYYLVLNRVLRERNRVRDAVREACRIVDQSGVV